MIKHICISICTIVSLLCTTGAVLAQADGTVNAQETYTQNVGKGFTIKAPDCPRGAVGCSLFSDGSATDAVSGVSVFLFKALDVILKLISSVAVLMVIIAGFRYAISRGDSGELKNAQKQLLWSLGGLVIIVTSMLVTENITKLIFKTTTLEAQGAAAATAATTATTTDPTAKPNLAGGGVTATGVGATGTAAGGAVPAAPPPGKKPVAPVVTPTDATLQAEIAKTAAAGLVEKVRVREASGAVGDYSMEAKCKGKTGWSVVIGKDVVIGAQGLAAACSR